MTTSTNVETLEQQFDKSIEQLADKRAGLLARQTAGVVQSALKELAAIGVDGPDAVFKAHVLVDAASRLASDMVERQNPDDDEIFALLKANGINPSAGNIAVAMLPGLARQLCRQAEPAIRKERKAAKRDWVNAQPRHAMIGASKQNWRSWWSTRRATSPRQSPSPALQALRSARTRPRTPESVLLTRRPMRIRRRPSWC